MKNKRQKFITFALLLSAITYTSAQSVKELKLDNKQSILNDKAFFNFPKAAVNSAREVSIMSADRNINQETRIVMDTGTMRLVFFAQEIYKLADPDLPAVIAKDNGDDFKTKVLTDAGNLLSILSAPLKFDSTQNAILVNSLLVKTQDNSLFRINAYINADAFKLKDDFITLTEKVFRTLSAGTRKTDYKAKEETLKIFGTKKDFKFSLPENYCITVDQKYDFQVFKFHKYTGYADTNWVGLTIYVGNHPSYFYKHYGLDPAKAEKAAGRFLNKDVDWLLFYNAAEKTYIKEQQIPSDNIDDHLIVHIAMVGNTTASIEELTKITEAIKLK